MSWAYNEIDPVAAFGGDVCCQISTSFVLFKDAKFHGLHLRGWNHRLCVNGGLHRWQHHVITEVRADGIISWNTNTNTKRVREVAMTDQGGGSGEVVIGQVAVEYFMPSIHFNDWYDWIIGDLMDESEPSTPCFAASASASASADGYSSPS